MKNLFTIFIELKKPQQYILIGLLLLSICGLAFFTPPYLDYFYFKGGVEKDGIYRFLLTHYFYLDGRFATLPALFQISIIKYLPHNLIIFTYVVIFISAIFYFYKIIQSQLNLNWNYGMIVLLILTFFYGFHTHIRESVFWAVGGVYSLFFLLTMVWLLYIEKLLQSNFFSIKHYLAIILSFIVGGVSQNLFPALFIFNIYLLFQKKSIPFFNKIINFTATTIGFLVIAIAPGNFKRIDVFEGSAVVKPLELFNNYIEISINYIHFSWVLFVFIVLVAIYSAFTTTQKLTISGAAKKELVIKNTIFILMAFSTIAPMSFIPKQAAARTAIFFMPLMSLAIFNLTYLLAMQVKLKLPETLFHRPLKHLVIITLVLLHLLYIPKHYIYGYKAYENQKKNEQAILKKKQEGEKIISIKEVLTPKTTFTTQYTSCPLSSDPNYFANQQLSLYYKVDAIIGIKE